MTTLDTLFSNKSTLPIQDILDPFARYQMPILAIRRKDKGQYFSTYITNLTNIAKALKVKPNWLAKYFTWDLSTQAKWNGENNELHLKGNFNLDILTKSLRKFINIHVLCPKCNLPELDYERINKKYLVVSCRACGHLENIKNPSDRTWKLILAESKLTTSKKK